MPSATSLRDTWRFHRNAWSAWWGRSVWNRLVILTIVAYGILFSILTSLRILALSAFALDLGLYNQAMYTTVTYGRFFYISGLPPAGGGSFFGGHFSPILILLLPLYALAPSPFTLVVIQSWAVALGAAPTYRLAQKLLKSDLLAYAFALVFLLDPATQGVLWFDFHVEAFLLLTLPAMLYFYERENWKWFVLFAVLALATVEMAAVLLAVVALVALGLEVWGWRVARRPLNRRKVWGLAALLIVSSVWIYAAGLLIQLLNPQSTYFSAGLASWSILGAPTPLSIPSQILFHPDRALAALSFDASLKAWYLIVLLAPVQLLTLRSPRATVFCMPWLVTSLVSNFRGFYLVGNQYPAYVVPFIFYGAIVGLARPWSPLPTLRRFIHWPHRSLFVPPRREQYARILVALTVVLLIVVSPIGPWGLGSDSVGRAPVVDAHDQAVLQLYGLIPADASVLTQNNLYPLLSSRMNVHFVPLSVDFPPGTSFNGSMDLWTSTMDYILVDFLSSYTEAALVLSWGNVSTSYSVVGASDGALLLQHGSHILTFFRPLVLSFDSRSVVPRSASIVGDADASTGLALFHPNITTSDVWYGPFPALPPGEYTAVYRIKVDRPAAGPVLDLPVILHPMNMSAQVVRYPPYGEQVFFQLQQLPALILMNATELQGASLPAVMRYFTVSTNFTVQRLGPYDFPGLAASGGVELWFDNLTIIQRAPSGSGTMPIVWSSA